MFVFIMGTIMLVVFFDTVYKKFWIFPEIFRVEGCAVIIVSFSEGYMFFGKSFCLRRFTKGYYIKQLKMDCQPTEFTALSRHRAVFSWAGKGGIPICGA